jgi:hypothetical protein
MLPVVHSGASYPPIFDAEAERPDQPQLGPQCDASPADVTGVFRDFRLMEDNVENRVVCQWSAPGVVGSRQWMELPLR